MQTSTKGFRWLLLPWGEEVVFIKVTADIVYKASLPMLHGGGILETQASESLARAWAAQPCHWQAIWSHLCCLILPLSNLGSKGAAKSLPHGAGWQGRQLRSSLSSIWHNAWLLEGTLQISVISATQHQNFGPFVEISYIKCFNSSDFLDCFCSHVFLLPSSTEKKGGRWRSQRVWGWEERGFSVFRRRREGTSELHGDCFLLYGQFC